jgi:hypothetical protein
MKPSKVGAIVTMKIDRADADDSSLQRRRILIAYFW